MGLSEKQTQLCSESTWDFSDLKAMFLNCTLKKSPELSHTQGLIDISSSIMEKNGVSVECLRPVDFQIATGVWPDMTEHGWDQDDNIFNFEGGCYAKVLNLSKEKEPEIFGAISRGALLENVILDNKGEVDFKNKTITQNSRVSYPIYFINNIKQPSIGNNPKNIFFLTADAFGVLPPISKLTPSQSAYHFIFHCPALPNL